MVSRTLRISRATCFRVFGVSIFWRWPERPACSVPHMTRRLDAAITQSPEARVQSWLADFESALAAREIDRAVAKFSLDSIWRDLVAFTWNIKTVEGRDGIAGMLRARLADTDPSGFRTREPASDDGG